MKGSTGIILTQGGDAWATAVAVDGSGHANTPSQSTTAHHSSNAHSTKPTIGEKLAGLGNEILGKITHNPALEEHGKHMKSGEENTTSAASNPQSDITDTAPPRYEP